MNGRSGLMNGERAGFEKLLGLTLAVDSGAGRCDAVEHCFACGAIRRSFLPFVRLEGRLRPYLCVYAAFLF